VPGFQPRGRPPAIVVALVLRHFIKSGGDQLIRELCPRPQPSLILGLPERRALAVT
jgi:hypothetical protein